MLNANNCVFANFSYVQYSAIAARTVRKALKDSLKVDAGKRDVTAIKFTKWENGKAVGKCLNYFRYTHYHLVRTTHMMTRYILHFRKNKDQ